VKLKNENVHTDSPPNATFSYDTSHIRSKQPHMPQKMTGLTTMNKGSNIHHHEREAFGTIAPAFSEARTMF